MSTPRTPILWSMPAHRHALGPARSTMKAVIESWARLGRLARLGEHRVPVGLGDPRHPALGARQHPPALAVGVRHCPGPHAHRRRCRPGAPTARTRPAATPSAMPGRYAPLLLLGPGDQDRPGREPGEQQHEGGRVRVLGDLLDGDREAEDARPRPAESSGMHRPSRPASRKASKRSSGYSPVRSISRARGSPCPGPAAGRCRGAPPVRARGRNSPAEGYRCRPVRHRGRRPGRTAQADLRRWRMIRRRSRSVVPPQTPSRSRAARACSRHAWRCPR